MNKAVRKILEAIEADVESCCSKASETMAKGVASASSLEAKKRLCDAVHGEINVLIASLTHIANFPAVDNGSANLIRMRLASTLRELALVYNNEVEDYVCAEKVLREAQLLAGRSSIAVRILQDLAVVSLNALNQRAAEVAAICGNIINQLEKSLQLAGRQEEKKNVCDTAFAQFKSQTAGRLEKILLSINQREGLFTVGDQY